MVGIGDEGAKLGARQGHRHHFSATLRARMQGRVRRMQDGGAGRRCAFTVPLPVAECLARKGEGEDHEIEAMVVRRHLELRGAALEAGCTGFLQRDVGEAAGKRLGRLLVMHEISVPDQTAVGLIEIPHPGNALARGHRDGAAKGKDHTRVSLLESHSEHRSQSHAETRELPGAAQPGNRGNAMTSRGPLVSGAAKRVASQSL